MVGGSTSEATTIPYNFCRFLHIEYCLCTVHITTQDLKIRMRLCCKRWLRCLWRWCKTCNTNTIADNHKNTRGDDWRDARKPVLFAKNIKWMRATSRSYSVWYEVCRTSIMHRTHAILKHVSKHSWERLNGNLDRLFACAFSSCLLEKSFFRGIYYIDLYLLQMF